jgi:hypothetical protein
MALANTLSALRKYRVGFAIAHQYMHQLDPPLFRLKARLFLQLRLKQKGEAEWIPVPPFAIAPPNFLTPTMSAFRWPIVQRGVVSVSIRPYDCLFSQEHEHDACCSVYIQACVVHHLQWRLLQAVQLARARQRQRAASSCRIQMTGSLSAR